MPNRFKVLAGAVILSLLVVSFGFLSSNEYLQGKMKLLRRAPVAKHAVEARPEIGRNVDTFASAMDMKNIKKQFEAYKRNMPKQVIGIPPDSIGKGIFGYNKLSKYPYIDPAILKMRLWDHEKFVGLEPDSGDEPPDDPGNPFIDDLGEYLDTLSWEHIDEGQPKENYLFVFPIGAEVSQIDPEDLDPGNSATWKLASAFAICVVGNEAATVHSPVFQGRGEPNFQQKLKATISKYNDATGEYDTLSMWDGPEGEDKPVVAYANWDIQFTSPETITLNPNQENQCTAVAIQYMDVYMNEWADASDPSPAWEQVQLKGVASNLPAYYVYENKYLHRIGEEQYGWGKTAGSINVFEPTNEVYVYKDKNNSFLEKTTLVNSEDVWMDYFGFVGFPHTTDTEIEGFTLQMDSTGYDDLELDITLQVNTFMNNNLYNNPLYTNFSFDTTLEEGENYIEFPDPIDVSHAREIGVDIIAKQAPPTPGTIQLSVTDLDGNLEALQGDCWNYPHSECLSPLTSVTHTLTNVIAETAVMDPLLRLSYWPVNKYNWNKKWFSNFDLKDGYDGSEPELFYVSFQRYGDHPDAPAFEIDEVVIDVLGNYTSGMGIESKIPGSITGYPEEINEHLVVPGDQIILDEIYMPKYYDSSLRIAALSVPSDAGVVPKNVRFKIDKISAHYTEDGINVSAGDPVPVIWDMEPDFDQFPMIAKYWFMGNEMLHVASTGESSLPQDVFLDDFEAGQNEEFELNQATLMAQGDLKFYGYSDEVDNPGGSPFTYTFKYKHMYDPTVPSNDLILQVGNDKIYFNDAVEGDGFQISKWTDEYLEFTLTNAKYLNHGDYLYLSLTMEMPTEPMNNVWFKLVDISVTTEDGVEVGAYTEVMPELVPLEEDFVNGPTYNFYCDDFDHNWVCDKNE